MQPPTIQQPPRECLVCDTMAILGLGNATCESQPDMNKKIQCRGVIKQLEEQKKTPIDTMTELLYLLGEDGFDEATDRINLIVYEASARAKDRLIKEGRLNKDGTPK